MIPRYNNPVDLLPEDSAQELLRPYFEKIMECFDAAWGAWETLGTKDPAFRKMLGTSARAFCVSDHIRGNVRRAFHGREIEGIQIRDVGKLFLLDINGKALVRFKKLNFDLLAMNIKTHQQKQLQFQLQLPGMPPDATHLTAGYVLDDLQTSIDQMVITCRVGEELKYKIPLNNSGEDILPISTDQPDEPPTGFIVRALKKNNEASEQK